MRPEASGQAVCSSVGLLSSLYLGSLLPKRAPMLMLTMRWCRYGRCTIDDVWLQLAALGIHVMHSWP